MSDKAKELLKEAREILLSMKRGSCWCEAGIGNPMAKCGEKCKKIKEFIEEAKQ